MLQKKAHLDELILPALAFHKGMGFDVKIELILADMILFNVTTVGLSTSVKNSASLISSC